VYDPEVTKEFASFKHPHYLQACTEFFPNMEGAVCKTTNSRPKGIFSKSITLLMQKHDTIDLDMSFECSVVKIMFLPSQKSSPLCVILCKGLVPGLLTYLLSGH
jgi:hypothetical protein